MRDSSCSRGIAQRLGLVTGRGRTVLVPLVAAFALGARPAMLRAQWPGEVAGRVVDAVSARPLDGAVVEATLAPRFAVSDAAGRFFLTGLTPGRHELVVRRAGYATLRREVDVANGRRTSVRLALQPVALPLEGLEVAVEAREGRRVEMGSPASAGARTAADLLGSLAGVSVTSRGPGAAQTVSIRGSGAGAVLVLLDGVPLNDPVTGEADLSTLPAASLASATVLPGARSARYGAGAAGGVVLLESRRAPPAPAVDVVVGSLGRAGATISAGGRVGRANWSAAVGHERLGGGFAYALPATVGGGAGTRDNADEHRTSVRVALDAGAGGGLRLRAMHDRLERGLPGRAFAPSTRARQEDARTQLSLSWDGGWGEGDAHVNGWIARRAARLRDPAPPLGLPYDASTRTRGWGVDVEMRRDLGALLAGAIGADVVGQSVDADALAGPRSRADAAARATLMLGPLELPGAPSLRVTGRLHRGGRTGAWRASHEAALAARAGALALHVAHRSAWTPPSLADLFFREGVGVRPNPDLRAERIPSEIEVGATLDMVRGPWTLRTGVSAYDADVRGMVVWAPDFRFVWSPRNVDVRRRGLEAWADLRRARLLGGTLLLAGNWSHARVTYDRQAEAGAQLAYRPRHGAALSATWSGEAGGFAFEGRWVGLRYPTAAPVNPLPGFWAWDASAVRTWRLGGWRMEARLGVERVFDGRSGLIFGFPHPGRTLSLGVAVRAPNPLTLDRDEPNP